MRLPFLRSKTDTTAPPRAGAAARQAPTMADDPSGVEAARTQARRRLAGAVVLLVIGVLGFPVLFETQPRPLPSDTPMLVAHHEGTAGGPVVTGSVGKDIAVPPALPAQRAPSTLLPPDGGAEEAPLPRDPSDVKTLSMAASVPASVAASPPAALPKAAPAASSGKVTPKPAAQAASARSAVAVAAVPPKPAVNPAPRPAAVAAALPKPASGPAGASADAVAPGARWVVQAGAYTEAAKLQEARAKIERLGLKTYTQVVETDKGSRTRVRVGPYAGKAEAEAVAARVKKTGLQAAVLAL